MMMLYTLAATSLSIFVDSIRPGCTYFRRYPCLCLLKGGSLAFRTQTGEIVQLWKSDENAVKAVESRDDNRNILEAEVVRPGAISTRRGPSEEELTTFQNTETFRPWSN